MILVNKMGFNHQSAWLYTTFDTSPKTWKKDNILQLPRQPY